MKLFLYIILILNSYIAYSMMYDGIHLKNDYINIAKNHKFKDSICKITSKNSQRTGVLVSKNYVLTAAHGLNIDDKVTLEFENFKTEGVVVEIDDDYFTRPGSENSKFDKAIIKLNTENSKNLIPKIKKTIVIQNPLLLTVITYGSSDENSVFSDLDINIVKNPELRGFHLFELDEYFSSTDNDIFEDERPFLFSSLFFTEKRYGEEALRTKEAVSNWKNFNKLPYAMALPGTSGSPVFIKIENEDCLLGMVVAYGNTDGSKVFKDINLSDAISKMHTIIIPLYRKNKDNLLIIDKKIEKYITICE